MYNIVNFRSMNKQYSTILMQGLYVRTNEYKAIFIVRLIVILFSQKY